jgi:inosine/xanthosine triphosphate pyrophosphatase family protein
MKQLRNMKRNIYFATSNPEKIYQIKQIFQSVSSINIVPIIIDIDEIQSLDNQEVIEDKIVKAYNYIITNFQDKIDINNFELICEDTGYNYDNMNGFPGALVRYYHDQVGNDGICKFNGGSGATNVSIVAYTDGTIIETFKNSVRGKVPLKPQFNSHIKSFGLDPVFIPDYKSVLDNSNSDSDSDSDSNSNSNNNFKFKFNFDKLKHLTYAEIPSIIKNMVSARGKSFNDLKEFLLKF